MTLGIIDVGTNSIHLVIGIVGLEGCFHVLVKERELARLGAGGLASRRLAKPAMRRAEKVLRGYTALIERFGVDRVEAVATSAVRDAKNGKAFVRRIRRKLGLRVRIISGHEEARLIYLGVSQTAGIKGSTLMISLGGGSAEVMVGDGHQLRFAACRRLGCARLAETFIRHDPAQPQEIAALRQAVSRTWQPVIQGLERYRWRSVIGTSATIQQLLVAAYSRQKGKRAKKESPVVTRSTLAGMVKWLEGSSAAMRKKLPGLDPKRQDLVLPTGIALLAFMEGCGASRMRHAPGSLREGLVVDYLIKHHQTGKWIPRLARRWQARSGCRLTGANKWYYGRKQSGSTGRWRKRIMIKGR